MWNRNKEQSIVDSEAEHAPIETPRAEIASTSQPQIEDDEHEEVHAESEERKLEAIYERAWKEENPGKTLKRERQLYRAGVIDELPWNNIEFCDRVLKNYSVVRGFGNEFPENPIKGDMFLRVDSLPSTLYKFNGSEWIAVDKSLSDQYAYNDAYTDYLIEKIGTGEYDPELLSDAERDCIEQKLKTNSFKA
jgi:hypothetical protein